MNPRYLSTETLTKLNYVLIDFDDVIAKKIWPEPGIGKPMPNAFRHMRKIKKMGFNILIFTARPWADIKPIKNWLKDHHVSHLVDEIHCGKPLAKLIIDDGAFRLKDWKKDWDGIERVLNED